MDRCDTRARAGNSLSIAASERVHQAGWSESLSLFDLTFALAPFARMGGKTAETRGATFAIAGRTALHLGGLVSQAIFTSFQRSCGLGD